MAIKQSKIAEFYTHFSKVELENIAKLIRTGFFGNGEILIKAHEYLTQADHGQDLDKVELYKYIYGPKKPFSDIKLRVYLTKLTQVIEKYIVLEKLDEFPLAELTLALKYYSQNHLHKNAMMFFKSRSDIQFDNYEEYLQYTYQYELRRLDYYNIEFSNDGDKIKDQFSKMMQAHKELLNFQTLKSFCDYNSLAQKYQISVNTELEETIIEKILEDNQAKNEIISAYLTIYQFIKTKDESYIYQLKEIVLNSDLIPFQNNVKAIFTHYQNFCVQKISMGQTKFLKELLDGYKYSLKSYKKSGDLDSGTFRNIVFCALQINELEWTEKFVENYSRMVNENEVENAYNFNLARISFQKGDLKTAMRQLLKVTYDDAFYAASARTLLIKCYFELNDEMPLMSCCLSLLKFLDRNKELTKQRVDNIMGFIRHVKTLQKNRLKNNPKYFEKLVEKIELSSVIEKDWLKKQAEKLI